MYRFACLVLALVAVCSGAAIPEGIEDRIVGGSIAVEGQIPWQVSLRGNKNHRCGGVLLNERWILSAAHCLIGTPSQQTIVTNTLLRSGEGDIYRVYRYIQHPEYDSWTLKNDIGLLEVERDIVFSDNVQPVRLPTSAFTAVDYPAVVSGWGRTSFPNGDVGTELQVLTVKTVSDAECINSSWRATDDNICTLTIAGEGTCNGDSGGPLTADNILIGIVSFGTPCALGIPDAYVRVFNYLDWIKEYTG